MRRALLRGGAPVVALIYPRSPLTVVDALRPDLVVYHVSDDFSERPAGRPEERFAAWEARALRRADLVLAVSPPLAGRLAAMGHSRAELLPCGFDARLFVPRSRAVPSELEGVPRPIVGFAGTVRADRIDLGLLRLAAAERPAYSIVFLGERFGEPEIEAAGSPGTRTSASSTSCLPRRFPPSWVLSTSRSCPTGTTW